MNTIKLSGCAKTAPKYSHQILGEKFYEFYIETIRKSGVSDTLRCVVSETLANSIEEKEGLEVIGEVRTWNITGNDGKKHCEVFVFVNEVNEYKECNGFDENIVRINGFMCKSIYRETPRGRKITDLILASNRERSYKSDYIPCIAWGRNALRASYMSIGTHINVIGRLQSREYTKKISDTEFETKVAYEVSIIGMEVVEDEK